MADSSPQPPEGWCQLFQFLRLKHVFGVSGFASQTQGDFQQISQYFASGWAWVCKEFLQGFHLPNHWDFKRYLAEPFATTPTSEGTAKVIQGRGPALGLMLPSRQFQWNEDGDHTSRKRSPDSASAAVKERRMGCWLKGPYISAPYDLNWLGETRVSPLLFYSLVYNLETRGYTLKELKIWSQNSSN